MTFWKPASPVVIVIAAVVAAGLASCSALPSSPDPITTVGAGFHGSVPDFTGPWAAEFAEAYRSTSDDRVRLILAKEAITDQDYATESGRYVKCMANKGFTVEIDGPAGEMTILDTPSQDDTDRANAASLTCGSDSGFIDLSALRGGILRNPENLDENTIVAACLVRKKIAPPSYTAGDYARDLETWTFPYSISSVEFGNCTSDPLDLEGRR